MYDVTSTVFVQWRKKWWNFWGHDLCHQYFTR